MLKPEDHWIGDWVIVTSSHHQGKYAGLSKNGKANIHVGMQSMLEVDFEDISLAEEPNSYDQQNQVTVGLEDTTSSKAKKKKTSFTDRLDLHFEVLQSIEKKELHEHILEFQLRVCSDFIKFNIQKKRKILHVVHGKGDGTLKREVERLLQSFPEVTLIVPRVHNGSLDIWLQS